MRRGGHTVLVVDDDSAIRKMVSIVLRAHGFQVLEAQNGLEAVQLYGSYRSEVLLVITDVEMPVMDGLEAVARIRSIDPGAQVLFMSGCAGELAQSLGAQPRLSKPFGPSQLIESIQGVLGREP